MRAKHKMDGGSPEGKLTPPTPKKSRMSSDKSKHRFVPPPEAPVFLPTLEEFENPLRYINKIRPIGQKTGICKIIPPAGWRVPFVLDMDKLKFTPRIQRINELEARTRLKLNFIDQLTKFFAQKGKTFQIPIIEKRTLDLYTLHKLVKDNGGPEEVSKSKKWTEIAQKLNYLSGKTPPLLKTHYDHLILPFITARLETDKPKEKGDNDGKATENGSSEPVPPLRELKSLTFLGPGPKMAVCDIGGLSKTVKNRTRGKKIMYEFDPLAKYMCKSCLQGDIEEPLVTCRVCEDRYHSSCLIPPLTEAAKSGWRCPKCVASEHCKSLEDFGFAQAEREYTLAEFKEMADNFKANYFKTSSPSSIPTSTVESEFWRVVSSIEESVTVEYGADLHVIDHGSGFPLKNKPPEKKIDTETFNKYADSAWNLNNLPVLKASVLRHISADISGMKIPWMYAGMCFATFCWHNEDHWSYSINYLHFGDPKTWYGVPGSSAEDFEKAMRDEAPELFDSQPDILHQLVTIMDPNDIMKTGVPIFRTDQKEGEFVITFPRAYHAGFNQGFNFAEACNFAPYDWLHIGRECITHYSSLKRFCVFSHDELVCKMAEIYDELDKKILLATYKDMKTMVNSEHTKRRFLLMQGIRNASRVRFDELPDDERQCFVCKTTCFLSALTCKCSPNRLVCLDHYEQLCVCPPSNYKLKFHYKIDELVAILYVMRSKVEHFDKWVVSVNKSSAEPNKKVYFRIFTELLIDSKDKEFTKGELLEVLESQVKNCIKISSTAKSYMKDVIENPLKGDKKVNIDDLIDFSKQLKTFPCTLVETNSIKKLVDLALKLKKSARKLLNSRVAKKSRVEHLVNIMKSVNFDFSELPQLEARLEECDWIERCNALLLKEYYAEDLRKLIEEGDRLPRTRAVLKKKLELSELSCSASSWSARYESVFNPPYLKLEEVERITDEGVKSIYAKLHEKEKLQTLLLEAQEINSKIDDIISGKLVLYLGEYRDIINSALKVPVVFKSLMKLQGHVLETENWMVKAKELFYKRKAPLDLMNVLWPRIYAPRTAFYSRSTSTYRSIEGIIQDNDKKFKKSDFKQAFKDQISSLFTLRKNNNNLKLKERRCCPCGSPLFNQPTLECELCCTVFHSKCFIIDEKPVNPLLYNIYNKLLCSFCIRTKRPSYHKVVELYDQSENLVVKVPECLALKYNVKKINSWLKNARVVLSYPDSAACIQIINENSRKIPDAGPDETPSIESIPDFKHVSLPSSRLFDLKYLLLEMDMLEVTTQEGIDIWLSIMAVNLFNFQLTKEFIPPEIQEASKIIKTKMQALTKATLKLRRKPSLNQFGAVAKKPKIAEEKPMELRRRTCRTRVTRQLLVDPLQGWSPVLPGDGWSPSSPGAASEHEEECAAESCQRPSEDSLDWVQCDGHCKQWFHMKCVDLTKQEITDDDEFICQTCLKEPDSPQPQSPPASRQNFQLQPSVSSPPPSPLSPSLDPLSLPLRTY